MSIRNENMWSDIWDHEVFQDQSNGELALYYKRAWEWSETLARDGRLTTGDLISLQALIAAVHEHGKEMGREENR